MPTYEYRCPEGHEFEKFFRTISGAPTAVNCPTCGKLAERQLSGGAGLLFKGSGFYLTDYGKNAHANKGPKPAPTESSKSEGSKSESSSPGDSKSSTGKSPASDSKSSGTGQPSTGGGASGGTSSGTGSASSGSAGTTGKSKPAKE